MDRYVVIDPNGQVVGRFPNTPNGCEEAKEYAKRLSENSNEPTTETEVELNKIRLDRLNKIADAKDIAKKETATANEETRVACVKRIKEYCIPKYAELRALEHALERATDTKSRLVVQVADGNSFLYYPGWHGDADKVGFAVSTGGTSTYYYTVTKEGELWKNCSYGKKFPMQLDDMPYWLAAQFVDGFDKWETELYRKVDAV